MLLSGKTILITGGVNGIGKATAILFLHHGAHVCIADVDDQGEALCEGWRNKGHNAHFYKVDITKFDDVSALANRIAQEHAPIQVLINNAGITRDSSLLNMTPDKWQQVIDVNLTGVFNCTKAVVPQMIEHKWGRIINASSVVSLYGNYGQTNYVASKAGVIGMTKTWAKELGKHNITVNAVAPGFILTDMVKSVPEHILSKMSDKSALKRLGQVNDIANAYLYLSSEMASYVTGTTLSVDGGLVI